MNPKKHRVPVSKTGGNVPADNVLIIPVPVEKIPSKSDVPGARMNTYGAKLSAVVLSVLAWFQAETKIFAQELDGLVHKDSLSLTQGHARQYPFTLDVFSSPSFVYSDSMVLELQKFISTDLKNNKKKLLMKATFLGGNENESQDALMSELEQWIGYNILKNEGNTIVRMNNTDVDLYADIYVPIISHFVGKHACITKEQLIFAIEKSFNQKVLVPYIDFLKDETVSSLDRMEQVPAFFDILGKYYERRNYLSAAADPAAPIKVIDGQDALFFASTYFHTDAVSNKVMQDAQKFDIEKNSIQENITILEGVMSANHMEGVGHILEKILASNQGSVFVIKYRTYTYIMGLEAKIKNAQTREELMKILYDFSRRIEYAQDFAGLLTPSGEPLAVYVKKILVEAYTSALLGEDENDTNRLEIANIIEDMGAQSQPVDLEFNDADGMTQSEMNENINDAAKTGNRKYEMYRYMSSIASLKVINDSNKALIQHIAQKDVNGAFLYSDATLYFDALAYISPENFFTLVDNINTNTHIQSVRFNLSLMKQAYAPENFARVLKAMGNLKKDLILDTEGEATGDIAAFVALRQKHAKGHSLTYNATRLSPEEATQLLSLPGSVAFPRCTVFPWQTNDAFEKSIQTRESQAPAGSRVEFGFYSLGKAAYRSLATVFATKKDFTVALNNITTLQKEELYWLNRVNASIETNGLSNQKVGKEAVNGFDFGLEPEKEGFFDEGTSAGGKKKTPKQSSYNNRALGNYTAVSEADMAYAATHYYGTSLRMGTGNLAPYHLKAYNAMPNLVTLHISAADWQKKALDVLAEGKITSIGLFDLAHMDDALASETVKQFGSVELPDFTDQGVTEYNVEKRVAKNTLALALCSGTGDVALPSIRMLDNGWEVAIRTKKGGTLVLTGVRTLALRDTTGKAEKIITADNAHEHKDLLLAFCQQLAQSKATLVLPSWLQRIYDDYKTL